MPNRIVRAGINSSDRVNQLDYAEEVFYRRLINAVDDYGLFDARPAILRAHLYPLRLDRVREADLQRWMAACQKAGLIVLYEAENKSYLQVLDTRWKSRSEPKYPLPPSASSQPTPASTQQADADKLPQPADACEQLHADENSCAQLSPYSETETDSETEAIDLVSADAETGPVQEKEIVAPVGKKQSAKKDDPLYLLYAKAYQQSAGCPYLHKESDFIQLASLRKKAKDTDWPLTDDKMARAVSNYFASDIGVRTFGDFCSKFTTYYALKLDRYNKPMEAANGNHKTHAIPGGNRGGNDGESQFRAKRQI